MDYLIVAHSTKSSMPNLSVFSKSGSNEWIILFWIFPISNFHWSFQNHMLVIGGEDGKINLWLIHPVELEEMEEMINGDDSNGDDGNGDELMDIDMPSSIRWKQECNGDDELVHFLLVYPSLTLSVLRQMSQTLLIKTASQAAHSESGSNQHFKFMYHDCHIWWQKLPCPSGYLQKQQWEWSIFTRQGRGHKTM